MGASSPAPLRHLRRFLSREAATATAGLAINERSSIRGACPSLPMGPADAVPPPLLRGTVPAASVLAGGPVEGQRLTWLCLAMLVLSGCAWFCCLLAVGLRKSRRPDPCDPRVPASLLGPVPHAAADWPAECGSPLSTFSTHWRSAIQSQQPPVSADFTTAAPHHPHTNHNAVKDAYVARIRG